MKQQTPKSLRLHIGIFGRTNVGKSSVLNLIAGQDVAITSPVAGTTTDVVEKAMELLPVGPVLFLDTAGLDDTSVLGVERIRKTKKVFDRSDIVLLIVEAGTWGEYEESVMAAAAARKVPVVVIVNKIDVQPPSAQFIELVSGKAARVVQLASVDRANRDRYVNALKRILLEVCPDDFLNAPPLVGDLIPDGGTLLLVVPIDIEAPKSRLILPQVQTIRDALDHNAPAIVVKEREYVQMLAQLRTPPALVVGDSQVVHQMVADTPANVKCTTFSILFARHRGDLVEAAKGAARIRQLKAGDRVLIAEACSHHAMEDDIGRVKIPRWLRQHTGLDLTIDVSSGSDYPDNLADYKLVIHCGGCMINRRLMLARIQKAQAAGVAITNYGVCISYLQGVAERVLAPFPAALEALRQAQK